MFIVIKVKGPAINGTPSHSYEESLAI